MDNDFVHDERSQPLTIIGPREPTKDDFESKPSFDIKSYIESHPGALKGLFSGYQSDIESLLDSAGPARSLIEGSIKDKCPWLWSAVYDEPDTDLEPPESEDKNNGNGRKPSAYNPNRHTRKDEDEDSYEDEIWDEAMEYGLERLNKGDRYAVISDKLYMKYHLDLSAAQVKHYLMSYEPEDRDPIETPYKPRISPRLNDSIIDKVSGLMADKKGLESKIIDLQSKLDLVQNPASQKVGLIRRLGRWLW